MAGQQERGPAGRQALRTPWVHAGQEGHFTSVSSSVQWDMNTYLTGLQRASSMNKIHKASGIQWVLNPKPSQAVLRELLWG